MNTFFYSLKQGFANIVHNKMFSIASVATMAACIFMFGLFYAIITNFNSMLLELEENVAVTVFFESGTSDERMQEVGGLIAEREEVAEYHFVSAEEAWEDFKDIYFEGKDELAAGFEGDNPLANSANYEIYLSDVSGQGDLVSYLESLDGVREVQQSEEAANMLTNLNRLVTIVSIGIIIILLGVSIFLISNTVSTGITVRRDEIAIMKLIGATDFLVRAPFVVEGIVIGLVGAVIPLFLIYLGYGGVIRYIANHFSFIGSALSFVSASDVFAVLIPLSLVLGVGIGFIGSMITIRKHLKV